MKVINFLINLILGIMQLFMYLICNINLLIKIILHSVTIIMIIDLLIIVYLGYISYKLSEIKKNNINELIIVEIIEDDEEIINNMLDFIKKINTCNPYYTSKFLFNSYKLYKHIELINRYCML
jgi:hypothetical protein